MLTRQRLLQRPLLPVIIILISGLVSGCAGSAAQHAETARAMPPVPDDAPRIAIETFNVNFGMSGDAATVQAVAQQDADVIFLQETTPDWEQAIRSSSFAQSYPHMAFKQHQGAGGLAVISKFPIESIEYLPPTSWFPAARVVLQTPVGRVQVLNVHLRPPISNSGSVVSGYFTTRSVREGEIASFVPALDGNLPTLIVGDFNEGERGRAVSWLTAHGYRSALPEFQPQAKTWRWATSVGTLKGDYDHLCYDARLRPIHAEVRNAGQSDHLPVVGVFTLAKSAATQPRSEQPQ